MKLCCFIKKNSVSLAKFLYSQTQIHKGERAHGHSDAVREGMKAGTEKGPLLNFPLVSTNVKLVC